MHDRRGAFRLNFNQPAPDTTPATTAPATTPVTQTSQSASDTSTPAGTIKIVNGTNAAQPIDKGPSGGPYSDFDHQVQLDENLYFYWADPGNDAVLKARLEHRSNSMATAPSWLSFGFSHVPHNPKPVTTSNFILDKSTAIIGKAWTPDATPLIYNLGYNHDQPGIIQPMDEQNIIEIDFLQFSNTEEGGEVYSTLSFSKSMRNQSPNEPPIVAVGDNVFMWATGPPGKKLTMCSTESLFASTRKFMLLFCGRRGQLDHAQ